MGFGLDVTTQAGRALHGIGSTAGVVKKAPPKSNAEYKEEMHECILEEMKDFFFGSLSIVNSGVAFGWSGAVDFLAAILNPFKLKRWIETIFGITNFFIVTGIGEDFIKNAPDLLNNLIIMGLTQDEFFDDMVKKNAESVKPTKDELDEGFR